MNKLDKNKNNKNNKNNNNNNNNNKNNNNNNNTNIEYNMYIFVNNDLNMSKGKIASQVGHVVLSIVEHILNNKKSDEFKRYKEWKNQGQPKIILKATEHDINMLKELSESKYIIDAGKTEINPGNITVVGFLPNEHLEFKKFTLL